MAEGQDSQEIYEVCQKQKDHCQNLIDAETKSGGSQHGQLLQKALLSAELSLGLLKMKNVDKNKAVQQALQKHVESVLDTTYYQECVLVDQDFLSDSAIQTMKDVIGQITDSVKVCGDAAKILSILGEDILECLHWRPGALMYMFCHTIMNNEDRKKTTPVELLKECCKIGVGHFKRIFEVRSCLKEGESYTTNDEDLPKLLKSGIRSDSHMLALAYGGELCYWYHSLSKRDGSTLVQKDTEVSTSSIDPDQFKPLMHLLCSPEFSTQWCQQFNPVTVGIELLTKYVEVAHGAMRMQSWNCDRPEEILSEFRKEN